MASKTDEGKTYHRHCTGPALETANRHASDDVDITFFAGAMLLSVRAARLVGIGIPRYSVQDEVDPYAKPKELLEVSPKGLVPGLRFRTNGRPRALNESTVILEYLEDLARQTSGKTLLPPSSDPYARALVRLKCDHVNRSLIPAFYRYLQAQDATAQIEQGKEYVAALEGLVKLLERGEEETDAVKGGVGAGLWREGGEINLLDIMVGPWIYRSSSVLAYYRGFMMPSGPKFSAYIQRLFEHPSFKSTCSTEQLYLDSYERYAYNRPNTSQVANAINSGRALP